MKIGIVCAGDTELEPFLLHIAKLRTYEKAMLKFYEGTIHQVPVVALYSGVCKVNAAIATQILLDVFSVDLVINAGTAGGMEESVQLFDTIITEQCVYHDVTEDTLTEFHPWMESAYFPSDSRLLAVAKDYAARTAVPIRFGKTVTGEQFITDQNRREINEKYAPLSVDMETASIAHVCYVNRVPFIAIRTITDTAVHAGIENFEKNCEKASEIAANTVIELLGDFASAIL